MSCLISNVWMLIINILGNLLRVQQHLLVIDENLLKQQGRLHYFIISKLIEGPSVLWALLLMEDMEKNCSLMFYLLRDETRQLLVPCLLRASGNLPTTLAWLG